MWRGMRPILQRRAAPRLGHNRDAARAALASAYKAVACHSSRAELLLLAMCLAACARRAVGVRSRCAAQTRLSYPAAPRGTVVEDYHGVSGRRSLPLARGSGFAGDRAWVQAEADADAVGYLDALPQRARLRARIAALYDFERTGIPFHESGPVLLHRATAGDQDQSVLLHAAPLAGAPAVALDPNLLPAADHPVVVGYVASHDARLLAYAVVARPARTGREWRIRDLDQRPGSARRPALHQVLPAGLHARRQRPLLQRLPRTARGRGAEHARIWGTRVYYHALGSTRRGRPAAARAMPRHPDWQYQPHPRRPTAAGWWCWPARGRSATRAREDVYLMDLAGLRPAAPVAVACGFRGRVRYMSAPTPAGCTF